MKKFKILSLVLCAALIMATAAACDPAQPVQSPGTATDQPEVSPSPTAETSADPGGETGVKAANIVQVTAKNLEATDDPDANAAIAAQGANDFAFKLSAELLKDAANENFVVSPYSVWFPLAALLNATDAENKAALQEALSASGITEADINRAASRMLYDLTREKSRTSAADNFEVPYYNPLKIANAIFLSKDYKIKESFAQNFADCYRGTVFNVDFSSKDAASEVNRWASDNTEGLIPEIISEFSPEEVAAIANTIYFSDRWNGEFDPEQTKKDVFHAPGGDTEAEFMLREGYELSYYENDKLQAMPLSFKKGGTMYIILPKDGNGNGLLASMTSEDFNSIRDNTQRRTGKLLLPKFSIESGTLALNDALKALGVPLFDKDTAPLTGGIADDNTPMWLSNASHKALIKVDEKGTTAAAVTIMTVAGAGLPEPTEPFTMNCDKPFVFILCDRTSDGGSQILFTGVVNNPQS